MRRLATVLIIALAAVHAFAENPFDLKSDDIPKVTDKKPFDFEAGPDAATLKGKGVFFDFRAEMGTPAAPTTTTSSPGPSPTVVVPWTPFISYDVNATYNYSDSSKRIAEVSLQPSVVRGWARGGDPFAGAVSVRSSIMPYLDLRSRNTNAPSSTTDDKQKSFFYGGAGVQFRQEFRTILTWEGLTGTDFEQPTLGMTYYKKISGNLPMDAPQGFDAVQARLTLEIPIPLTASFDSAAEYRRQYTQFLADSLRAASGANVTPVPPTAARPSFPFSFSVDFKVSRPTDGTSHKVEHFADLALKMIQPGAKVGYVLRYRTGKDLGFEYDRKLLAGVLLRLFD
ncbi:MAG TPA: hypothetical protein VF713_18810 [Thermoanaerobaculia bacterium]